MIRKPQLGTQNIIFDLYLVKFADAKLADTKGKLPFFEKKKKLSISGPMQFKTILFKDQL